MALTINALVEGVLDEAVAKRLVAVAGLEFGTCYGKRGFAYVREKIDGFNSAAQEVPILVLLDYMDTRLDCPPEAASTLVPHRRPLLLLSVVVRELESWLLADRGGLARFLKVAPGQIPRDPEAVEDPKRALVNLARRSRSKTTRDALVPAERSTSQVGKRYNAQMMQFVYEHWSINAARAQSRSLDRCVRRLEELR